MISIRPMAVTDIPAAITLWEGTPGMGLNPHDDAPESLAAFLRRNQSTCFAAFAGDGRLVGTALCGHDGRRALLYHVCVAQAARGAGVGKRMVAAVCAALQKEGIQKAQLVCKANNAPGNAFWQHQGWQLRDDLNLYSLPLANG